MLFPKIRSILAHPYRRNLGWLNMPRYTSPQMKTLSQSRLRRHRKRKNCTRDLCPLAQICTVVRQWDVYLRFPMRQNLLVWCLLEWFKRWWVVFGVSSQLQAKVTFAGAKSEEKIDKYRTGGCGTVIAYNGQKLVHKSQLTVTSFIGLKWWSSGTGSFGANSPVAMTWATPRMATSEMCAKRTH